MAATTKLQLYIENDLIAVIDKHASRRGKGDFVSQAIREYDQRLTIDETGQAECGTLEQLVSLVQRLEQRIMVLDSRRFIKNEEGRS